MSAHPERKLRQNRQARCPIKGCTARMRKNGMINHVVDKHPDKVKALLESRG